MVPSLFEDDEKETLSQSVRDEAVKNGCGVSKDELWKYFVKVCSDNLHVVLCMSPEGDKLRDRCRSFPGLVNNTIIDWFTAWPEEALLATAEVFLDENIILPEYKTAIVNHMMKVHSSVEETSKIFQQRYRRINYVTPKNYLDYISTYNLILTQKTNDNSKLCERLESGLAKIDESSVQLDILNQQLAVQNVAVKEKTEACNQLLEEITVNTKTAVEKKNLADKKAVELESQGIQIAKDKEEAEQSLAEALPALELARNALNNLSSSEITEIRSFAKPPREVQKVCECICWIKALKDVSWKSAKGMMSQTDFKTSLTTVCTN